MPHLILDNTIGNAKKQAKYFCKKLYKSVSNLRIEVQWIIHWPRSQKFLFVDYQFYKFNSTLLWNIVLNWCNIDAWAWQNGRERNIWHITKFSTVSLYFLYEQNYKRKRWLATNSDLSSTTFLIQVRFRQFW